jgi:hypothetical protein
MRIAPALFVALLALAAGDGGPLTPAAPAAPAGAADAGAAEGAAPAPAPAPAPARATLVREGVQTVTLDLVNATGTPIVNLSAMIEGRPGPNLLPAGGAIPAGGTFPLPAAVGAYMLRAELQAPGVFTPGRVVLRNVVVPRFPPTPAPRMQVTLR